MPPAQPNICDVCKGELVTREDDTEGVVKKRIRDYHEKTEPVLELFRGKELVVEVDGSKSPDEVQCDIRNKLGLTKS